MRQKYSAFYVINIIFQAIVTLLWQIGLALLLGYALVRWASAPTWIYVPIITLGALSGFVSMIRFILSAMRSLENIEQNGVHKERSDTK